MSTTAVAFEAPRWALSFYVRHLALVLGLSAVPATQRFISQLVAMDGPAAVLGEAVTLAARVLLVLVAVRLGIRRDPAVGPLTQEVAGRRFDRFVSRHWRALLLQGAGLGVLIILAVVIPEQVVPALVDAGPTYWAVLLAVKNLTVIPLTLLWWVGLARQVLVEREPAVEEEDAR